MAGRGFSLHVGVKSAFPHVVPLLPPLRGCDAAARALAAFARARGFDDVRVRVTREETRTHAVADWFDEIARHAVAGDLVVFSFAGHAVRVTLRDRVRREAAIVCADGAIPASAIGASLAAFAAGVRVVLIVEACYAGGLLAGTSPVAADVLLLAAAGDRRAPAATRAERLPPFSETLMTLWQGSGAVAGGYAGSCVSAGGVVETRLLHDRTIAAGQPFAI